MINRRILAVLVCIMLLFSASGCTAGFPVGADEPAFPAGSELVRVKVVRVKDGDTFVADIDGEEKTVRLIGIDTPESVHPDKSRNTNEGRMVSHYVKTMIEGKKAWLEFDTAQTDRYSRLLCYCWLDENTMLNALLLEKGLALTMTVQPNVKYQDYFTYLQKQARENNVGLWKDFFKGEEQ